MTKSIAIAIATAACALLGFAAPAYAWDFSCSPKDTTTIEASTPNIMLMLDRSG